MEESSVKIVAHATSTDEVDFAVVANGGIKMKVMNGNNNINNNNEHMPKSNTNLMSNGKEFSAAVATGKSSKKKSTVNMTGATTATATAATATAATATMGDHKKHTSTKERLSIFSFGKKIGQKAAHNNNTSNNNKNNNHYRDNTQTNNNNNHHHNNKELEVSITGQPAALPLLFTPTFTTSCQPMVPIGTPPRQHKFVKSSSLARLLGNTYNTKKFEKEEQKRRLANDGKFNTYGGRRRLSGPYLERFKNYSKEEGDAVSAKCVDESATVAEELRASAVGSNQADLLSLDHFREQNHELSNDLGSKAMRTLSRGLGKLWWRRTHSVAISTPDPEYKVSYLGNVLTGWAKGEGCVEKQLNTLWRNYTQNSKPDVIMRIKVCASGLKATTRQHGLTEYWANRITHCCAPKNFPRVFCWIYRHEGRKLKHELRCHAVLCSKEKVAHDICQQLKENLESALREFKREKILKQNARLSLANAAYDNPSLPRRKILLSVGGNNYRPPLERSKSAPKLMAIEEAIGEEEGEEVEETNEPEMKSCCQKDSLYPAMTLGRRRCRRGHSIRRTGKTRPIFDSHCQHGLHVMAHVNETKEAVIGAGDGAAVAAKLIEQQQQEVDEQQRNSYGSDDSDDFEKLLKHNDYDSSATLTNELLPYFELQLHKNSGSSSLGDLSALKHEDEPLSLLPTINSDPNAHPDSDYIPHDAHHNNGEDEAAVVVGLRRQGVCSDGEEELDYLDADDMYFRQASILNMLHRNSMRKMANISLSSDEGSSSIETNSSTTVPQYRHHVQSSISSNASSTITSISDAGQVHSNADAAAQRKQLSPDSDEGSISSGCETASTATANQDDISLNFRHSVKPQLSSTSDYYSQLSGCDALQHTPLTDEPITVEEIYQRLESRSQGRHNSDATTFSSSSSITLKMGASPATSVMALDGSSLGGGSANALVSGGGVGGGSTTRTRRTRRQREPRATEDTDSECSDESGYVEFQDKEKTIKTRTDGVSGQQIQQLGKPQPPPKPLPRRMLPTATTTTTVGTTTLV